MSSVQLDDAQCNQCGFNRCNAIHGSRPPAYWMTCHRCGYTYDSHPKIDRAHERRTGERRYLATKAGGVIVHRREWLGYGVSHIQGTSGIMRLCGLSRPPDDETVAAFEAALARDDVDETRSYLTRWDPVAQRAELIAGTWWDAFDSGEEEPRPPVPTSQA